MRVISSFFAAILATLMMMFVVAVFTNATHTTPKNICFPLVVDNTTLKPSSIPPAVLSGMSNRGQGSYTISVSICTAEATPAETGCVYTNNATSPSSYVAIGNAASCLASFDTPLMRPTADKEGFKIKFGSSVNPKDDFEAMILCNPFATNDTLHSRSNKFAGLSPNKNGGTTYMAVFFSHAACIEGNHSHEPIPTGHHNHSEEPSFDPSHEHHHSGEPEPSFEPSGHNGSEIPPDHHHHHSGEPEPSFEPSGHDHHDNNSEMPSSHGSAGGSGSITEFPSDGLEAVFGSEAPSSHHQHHIGSEVPLPSQHGGNNNDHHSHHHQGSDMPHPPMPSGGDEHGQEHEHSGMPLPSQHGGNNNDHHSHQHYHHHQGSDMPHPPMPSGGDEHGQEHEHSGMPLPSQHGGNNNDHHSHQHYHHHQGSDMPHPPMPSGQHFF